MHILIFQICYIENMPKICYFNAKKTPRKSDKLEGKCVCGGHVPGSTSSKLVQML